MTEHLESDLRDALAARAGELSHNAAARLRGLEYQPRTRSLRPPVAAGAVTAAGVAGVAIWAAGLGAGTTEAFAGWTPSPTAAGRGQVASAEAACKQRLLTMPGPGASVVKADDGLQPALTDSRGPFTFVIFAGRHTSASCITGPSFTSLAATASTGSTTVPAGQVTLDSSHMSTRDGRQLSFVEGHTASDVTGAALVLDDGTRVQASAANGWFVAWWPGSHTVRAAEVTTPSGTTTQAIHTPTAPPCPPAQATGAPGPCTSMSGGIGGTGGRSGVRSGSVSMNESTAGGPMSGSTTRGPISKSTARGPISESTTSGSMHESTATGR